MARPSSNLFHEALSKKAGAVTWELGFEIVYKRERVPSPMEYTPIKAS
jgi:hypothetical protein